MRPSRGRTAWRRRVSIAMATLAITLGVLIGSSLAAPRGGSGYRTHAALARVKPAPTVGKVVWAPRPRPHRGRRTGLATAPSHGSAPRRLSSRSSRPVTGAGKPARPAKPHKPAPALLPKQGKVLAGPASPAGSTKTGTHGTGHFGASHPGVGRLIIPPPSAAHAPKLKHFSPVATYSSTQLDNFSSQCGFGANETTIAQSSANPNLMVAGANTYYDNSGNCIDSHAGVYYSSDGGQHWHYEVMPNLIDPFSGDPVVTYDPVRQVFLFAFVEAKRGDATVGRIGVDVSSDGINWSRDTTLDANTSTYSTDKPSITVDQNPSSPHYGRVIVAWTQFFGNNIALQADHTDDGGQTWQGSSTGVNNAGDSCGNGTSVAFDANGDAMIAWAGCNSGNQVLEAFSADGGTTWNSDVTISATSPVAGAEDPNPADCFLDGGGSAFRCNSFPSLAGDPNSNDAGGQAFIVVWANVESITQGGVTHNVSEIRGVNSVDGGTTWNGGPGFSFDEMSFYNFGDKFFPAASFSPNGRLTVSYSSREDDPNAQNGTNPQGLQFDEHQTEATSLTSLRSNSYVSYTTDSTLGNPGSLTFIGDYAGNSSLDNNFDTFPIWTDLRNGFPDIRTQDVCYANCMTALTPDNPLFAGQPAGGTFQDFYSFNMDPSSGGSGLGFWNVVGLREGSDGTTVDDDTFLSSNRYFNDSLTHSSDSPPKNDYLLVNGNSGGAPNTIYFPQVHSFSSRGGPYSIEWDPGRIVLNTSHADGMAPSNVARVYDSLLSIGTTYYLGLRPDPGNTSNYSLTLHSASVASYQGRGNSVADSGDVAAGNPAFVTYGTGADPSQFDGVVVLNDNGGSGTYTVYRDTAAPSGTISIDAGAAFTKVTTLNLALSATNPTSGDPVSDMAFSINGGPFGAFQPYSTSASVNVPSGDGLKTVAVEFRNGAGAVSAPANDSITLDQTAPHTTAALSGTSTGCSKFFGNVTVTLTRTDSGSGVASTLYKIDGGTLHTYSVPFLVSGVGSHVVTYRSTDHAGNLESTETTSVVIVTPSLIPTPSNVHVGTLVALAGSNFKSGESVKVFLDSTSSPTLATLTANGSCAISGSIHVPAAVNGPHTLIGVGQTSSQQATHALSMFANVVPNTPNVHVGTHVIATLTGFKASQSVTLRWDNASTGTVLATTTTGTTGSGSVSFSAPAAVNGNHTVFAVGSGGTIASTTLKVFAHVLLSAVSGPTGLHVTATVNGFNASQSVTMRWDNSTTGTVIGTVSSTGTTGSGSTTIVIPAASKGNHIVYGVGAGGSPLGSAIFNHG